MLFEEDLFGATLVQCGEALRDIRTLVQGQTSLLQQSTLLELQQLRSQMADLNQKVLVSSLQLWNSTWSLGAQTNNSNTSSAYVQDLVKIKQELADVQLQMSLATGNTFCDPTCTTPLPLTNDSTAFCDSFFENCQTSIFPFERLVTIKNLVEFYFVNFYMGVSWAILMFVILVSSAIYTYHQHRKVKQLTALLKNNPRESLEQQPLIDIGKLGKALNRQSQR